MAGSAYARPAVSGLEVSSPRPHSAVVRVTHWLFTLSFFGLVLSGIAILLAHPFVLKIPIRGPGRYVHFLSAWICVLNGFIYVLSGIMAHRFGRESYSGPQRLTYLAVIFVLFPLMIASGLAMSPAVMSALPFIVQAFGGHQSARTVHFFITNVLVVFVAGHVVMVYLAGFSGRMRGMITGREMPVKENL